MPRNDHITWRIEKNKAPLGRRRRLLHVGEGEREMGRVRGRRGARSTGVRRAPRQGSGRAAWARARRREGAAAAVSVGRAQDRGREGMTGQAASQ